MAASLGLVLSGCKGKDQGDAAPPQNQKVITVSDMNLITIDKTTCRSSRSSPPARSNPPSELTATGTVFPDISREVPVISLANGRVVDIRPVLTTT